MFKRVEKRRRRQEKEEELGLDAETKEVLGLQDTDSDESESSDDSGSEDSGEEAEEVKSADASISDAEGGEVPLSDEEEEDELEGHEIPDMSVTEAVADPVYLVSLDPEVKACILCPGKLLKNTTMSDIHRASKAHNRRFTRFVELVTQAGPDANVRDLILEMNAKPKKAEGAVLSKRAEKRIEKFAAIKAKRIGRKERLKKKSAVAKANADVTPTLKRRKRKAQGPVDPAKDQHDSSKSTKIEEPSTAEAKEERDSPKAETEKTQELAPAKEPKEPPKKRRKVEQPSISAPDATVKKSKEKQAPALQPQAETAINPDAANKKNTRRKKVLDGPKADKPKRRKVSKDSSAKPLTSKS